MSIIEQSLIEDHISAHADWKWEYVHQFLTSVIPVVQVLVRTFDLKKMLKGCSDTTKLANEIDSKQLKALDVTLKKPNLLPCMEVLRCVSLKTDMEATKCEGCKCHQYILEDRTLKFSERLRLYRVESAGCYRKGKNAAYLAAGGADAHK